MSQDLDFSVDGTINGESDVQVASPGIYEANLVNVEVKNITKKDGTVVSENALVFEFKTKTSGVFTHVEYAPNERTTPENIQSLKQRVKHIMLRYMTEQDTHFAAKSWIEYAQVVADKLTNTKDIVVWIKVCGSEYQGKAKLQFTRYLGFIGSSQDSIRFGVKELEGNENWRKAIEEYKRAREEAQNLADDTTLNSDISDTAVSTEDDLPF